MSLNCQIVGMDGFQTLLCVVSPDITVCVRGRHAVGKSEGVYQAAAKMRSDLYKEPEYCERVVKALGGHIRAAMPSGEMEWVDHWKYDYGLPVVERRLSQMTEGDIIGLPELHTISDGVEEWRSTSFRPCDWLIEACQFPVMLFLDERNRALPGVKQAVFQLADSKVFYGHKLHRETRICVAENVGQDYQVEQSDPAEVSRWVTVELDPDDRDWLKWAEGKCHDATIEFVRGNPKALEHKGTFEPDKKYPDRRSWYKLDRELQRLGVFEAENPNDGNRLYIMAGAFLGPEWGSRFTKFVQERDREVSAEDILKSWEKARKRLSKGTQGISNEVYVELSHKLGDWIKKEGNKLTDAQGREFARFMFDCPAEPRLATYGKLSQNTDNLFTVHPYIMDLMVQTATGADTRDLKFPEHVKPAKSKETTERTKSKRGRGRKSKET